MISIPLWARLSFWAVLLAGGAWLGWNVESWREGAAKADNLETQLNTERTLHAKSEAARIKMAGERASSAGNIHAQIQEAKSRVQKRATVVGGCVIDDELAGVLNRARGYNVPGP